MKIWIARLAMAFLIQHGLLSLADSPDSFETFCLGFLAWCIWVTYEKSWSSK